MGEGEEEGRRGIWDGTVVWEGWKVDESRRKEERQEPDDGDDGVGHTALG